MVAQFAFLSCGLIFLGLVIAVAGIISMAPARASVKWTETGGEIITKRPVQPGAPTASPIRYRYTVREKVYTGSRFSFRGEPSQMVLARFTPGQVVRVYYDPSAPDRSVLEPGVNPAYYWPVGIGGLFFVLGLILSLAAFI